MVVYLDLKPVFLSSPHIGRSKMETTKDEKLDVAYVRLRNGKVAKTVEIKPRIQLDIDRCGEVLGIEVLSVSKLAPSLIGKRRKKKKNA